MMRKTFTALASSCSPQPPSALSPAVRVALPASHQRHRFRLRSKLTTSKPRKPSLPKEVDGERIYTPRETDERFVILKKPNPRYSKEGQRHRTSGYVIVRAILAADERVKHIEAITGLPDGLSEKAVEAARQIKFKPAMIDGKPVSAWVLLEYRFDIY